MLFNRPPNWPPTPPGWTPPQGWQPDPNWPPPPPDWQLWLPDHGRRRGKGLLIGGVVAVVAAVAIAAVVLVGFSRDSESSDQEQIRQLVAAAVDAWNSTDFEKFTGVACEEIQDEDFTESDFREQRRDYGRLETTVESVTVTGDTATAVVERKFAKEDEPESDEDEFVRVNGEWKYCTIGG